MAAFCLARNANTIGSPLFEIARVLVHLDHVALLEVACSIDRVPSTLDSRGRTIWIADSHRGDGELRAYSVQMTNVQERSQSFVADSPSFAPIRLSCYVDRGF